MSDLALHQIAAGMFTQAELAALASGTEPSCGLRKPAAPLVPRRRRTYRLQQTPFRFRLARAIIHLEQARPPDRLDGAEAWKRWIDYGPVRNLPKCESRPGTTRHLMTRNTGCCGCRCDCRTWSKPRSTRANPAPSQNRSAAARSQQKHGPPSVEPPQTSRPLFGPYQPICGRDRQRAHPNRAAQ
jgi:hypothetical protein